MTRRVCAVALLLAAVPPLSADDTADLLAEIKRVAAQGANSPAARGVGQARQERPGRAARCPRRVVTRRYDPGSAVMQFPNV